MKITIDTSDIGQGIGRSLGGGLGIGAKLISKQLKEKTDKKAIEKKAKSPFEPLVRQQRTDALVNAVKKATKRK